MSGKRDEADAPPVKTSEHGHTCDFCGAVVPSVRRVALDRDYDRLQQPHRVMYSCPSCFEQKEQRRTGHLGA